MHAAFSSDYSNVSVMIEQSDGIWNLYSQIAIFVFGSKCLIHDATIINRIFPVSTGKIFGRTKLDDGQRRLVGATTKPFGSIFFSFQAESCIPISIG